MLMSLLVSLSRMHRVSRYCKTKATKLLSYLHAFSLLLFLKENRRSFVRSSRAGDGEQTSRVSIESSEEESSERSYGFFSETRAT